jgi:hypothetical protein
MARQKILSNYFYLKDCLKFMSIPCMKVPTYLLLYPLQLISICCPILGINLLKSLTWDDLKMKWKWKLGLRNVQSKEGL